MLAACSTWPAVRDVILRAVAERRPTLVYGDYDVDGTVAACLLWRWLRSRSVPGNVFLPSRFKHGYGLDAEVVAQGISQGYKTLVALDCGTADLAGIEQAVGGGMEAAIIDHHQPKSELPAVPLLNPHLEPGLPPLCTAGLVYEALQSLSASDPRALQGDELELAGLATIADVVPLEPHNWHLAHQALDALPNSSNAGLAELVKLSRLHGLTRLTAQQVAFQLVPRLNAGGRMRSARLTLDLLCAGNPQDAQRKARELDALNQERKTVAERVFREAVLQGLQYEDSAAVALYSPDWHIGVLGIAAARVAEQLRKPAIVLTDDPRGARLLSGSARTYASRSLVELLATGIAGLHSFGGHADAAGVKVVKDQLAAFREQWAAAAKSAAATQAPPQVQAGAANSSYPDLALYELTKQFERDMWRLHPFGQGYAAPRCVLRGCRVARVNHMGRDKTHLSIVVTDGAREARLAAFNQSHLYARLGVGASISPVVEIDTDNWNNVYTITLRVIALD